MYDIIATVSSLIVTMGSKQKKHEACATGLSFAKASPAQRRQIHWPRALQIHPLPRNRSSASFTGFARLHRSRSCTDTVLQLRARSFRPKVYFGGKGKDSCFRDLHALDTSNYTWQLPQQCTKQMASLTITLRWCAPNAGARKRLLTYLRFDAIGNPKVKLLEDCRPLSPHGR